MPFEGPLGGVTITIWLRSSSGAMVPAAWQTISFGEFLGARTGGTGKVPSKDELAGV